MDRVIAALGFALFAVSLVSTPAHAVDVTSCGASVPDGETGTLQVDLDCSADPTGSAVRLGNHSRLELNGHSIVAGFIGVNCSDDPRVKACSINGPGDVSGGTHGIAGGARVTTVSGVTVHDTAAFGIYAPRDLEATDVTVVRAGNSGFHVIGRLSGANLTANDNHSDGIAAGRRLVATGVTANNNGFSGIVSSRFVVRQLTATGNGQSAIEVGGGAGVQGGGGTLSDAVLTGNDVDGTPIDVLTLRRPRLVSTTCDHSQKLGAPGVSWGVCAAD